MWPGCHGYEGPAWTYAGTVFTSADRSAPARGVTVRITDSTGEITLKTNSAGNFYTSTGDSAVGYNVSVSSGKEVRTMQARPATGECNGCHTPAGNAPPLHTD
jgi:hypothetical protein